MVSSQNHDQEEDYLDVFKLQWSFSTENDHCHLETMELIYEIWQYWDIHDYWLLLLVALKAPYVFIFINDTCITNKLSMCERKIQRGYFRVLIHIRGLLHYISCHYCEIFAWISKINEYKAISWQAHPLKKEAKVCNWNERCIGQVCNYYCMINIII